MRILTILAVPTLLAACIGSGPVDPGTARLAAGPACPLPVPERDTLLAEAIKAGDPVPIESFLDQRPEDATGLAARAILAGETGIDPDQRACLQPYL